MKPETISVVLDPEYGVKVFDLAERGPVWITPSPTNRAAAEQYWATKSDTSNMVTIWSDPRVGATEEEWLSILDDLQLHHGEEWSGPGIAGVEVLGASLTAPAESALREFGYERAENTPSGFRAVRSRPAN
jgi:hypothetical protein